MRTVNNQLFLVYHVLASSPRGLDSNTFLQRFRRDRVRGIWGQDVGKKYEQRRV